MDGPKKWYHFSSSDHLHYSHMIMLLCDASDSERRKKKTNDFFLLYNLHIALTLAVHL